MIGGRSWVTQRLVAKVMYVLYEGFNGLRNTFPLCSDSGCLLSGQFISREGLSQYCY
jgi:hypothetical protein